VLLLGGEVFDDLLHLGCKATPGRIRAVGLCSLRRRQLTAKFFNGTPQFYKYMDGQGLWVAPFHGPVP
jgi:hypothetical protein